MKSITESEPLSAEGRGRILEELPAVFDAVLVHATRFAGRSYVRVHVGGSSTQEVAVYLVNEAISRTLLGKRTWKHGSISLETHLFQTIRSIVSGYRKKEARRDPTPLDETLSLARDDSLSAEAVLEAEEECALLEEALLDAAGDDEQLLKLVEVILDGAASPADVCAVTEWPKVQVNVLFKKLRRRVRPILANQKDMK